jgi:hypothetical protein
VLNLKVPHHLPYLNRFGLPEDLVAAELVAERLAALVLQAKHIENIDSWTDAFLNYAKILVENHTTMASELFTYM